MEATNEMEKTNEMELTNEIIKPVLTPESIIDECLTDYKLLWFLTEKSGHSYDESIKTIKDMPLSVKKTLLKTEARLQKKREYYKNVVKPKKDAAKQAMQIAVLFEEV
jgi:hypothetical protein